MEIFNHYGPMLLALGFIDGNPGQGKMVMPDNPENLYGPPFMRDERGQVLSYYSIPGKLMVVAAGRHDPKNGILLMPSSWQIVYEWIGLDSHRYKVVIQDYDALKRNQEVKS